MAKHFLNRVETVDQMRMYEVRRYCKATNRWLALGVSELLPILNGSKAARGAMAMRICSIRRIIRERTGFYEGR